MTESVKLRVRDHFMGAVAGISAGIALPVTLVSASLKIPNLNPGPGVAIDLVAPFVAAAVSVPAGIALGINIYKSAAVGSAYRHTQKTQNAAPKTP
jgi:hypothetical protein